MTKNGLIDLLAMITNLTTRLKREKIRSFFTFFLFSTDAKNFLLAIRLLS